MWEFETYVSEIIRQTPTIKTFRFPTGANEVYYEPGQFFFVTIKVDGEEADHHFSFSSSPTEAGYIQFTKRITTSAYSQALDRLRPGDWARLKGPLGAFVLPPEPTKVAFLTGGIGITPQRSMLRYIADRGLPFDVAMLYGNSTWEEICFREELEDLSQTLTGFKLNHVLTNPPSGWEAPSGHIDSELVRKLIPDFLERLHYVSGPPRMVINLEDQLLALGVPDDQIKRDSFTGYD